MKSPSTHKFVLALLAANAVLLLCVALLLLRGTELTPAAWGQVPGVSASHNLVVMPAQVSTNTWGCYVLDSESRALCVYTYAPGEKMLKLQAARAIGQDLLLGSFNTAPQPAEIMELVERERKGMIRPTSMPAAGRSEK